MTLFAAWNDARATSARVHLPAWGAPVAVVQVADDDPVAPSGVLTVGDFSQAMTVEKTGPYGGSRGLWLIAGANGWRKTAPRQFYRDTVNGIKLSAVLRDVATKVGERVNVTTDRVLGSFWNRQEAPASRTLADTVGRSWWIDPLGTTQIGDRPDAVIAVDFDVLAVRPELGLYTLATEDLATWVPGAVFRKAGIVDEPQTISSVSITMAANGKLRLEVLVNL